MVDFHEKIARRSVIKGLGLAALATPFVIRPAFAATQVVNVLGVPGLHLRLWEEWAKMIREDTQGAIEVRYDPLGYAPAFAKIKTEAGGRNYSTDLFYGDAPFPERLVLDGLLDPIPYDNLPGTQELSPFARGEYTLEVFRTNWGVIGYNTNFVKPSSFDTPSSWEEFTNPRWKGRVGWVDPRGFPVWVPIVVSIYGEDGWIDYCKRLHANVGSYRARWIDNRQALQRGDTSLTLYNFSTTYISHEIDKASVAGMPIMTPEQAFGVLPVSIGVLKTAPSKEAAFKVLDLTSTAKYAKVMMDIGLNPSNNPANFPHELSDKTLALNHAEEVNIADWQGVQDRTLAIDWVDWAGKIDGYIARWEQEVLRG